MTKRWRPRNELVIGTCRYLGRYCGLICASVEVTEIEVLSVNAIRQRVTYQARGDYVDRWINRYGYEVEFTCWRPVREAARL